jgi:hypothetical protein
LAELNMKQRKLLVKSFSKSKAILISHLMRKMVHTYLEYKLQMSVSLSLDVLRWVGRIAILTIETK